MLLPAEEGGLPESVRKARDGLFEAFAHGLSSMLTERPGTPPRIVSYTKPPYPELPVDYVDTILIADIETMTPHLLGSGRGIYTEYRARIDRVLFNKQKISLAETVDIVELGGFIRLSNGRTLGQIVKGLGNQFELRDKYLLFLNYKDPAQAFRIWKAWKITNDKVYATAIDDLARVQRRASIVDGKPVEAIISAIQGLLPRN